MNPLSPVTYCRRHTKSTLAMLALIVLMTLGLSVMVRLPDSFVEHMFFTESYMTRVSLVSALGRALDPGLVSQIRSHPDVRQVMQEFGLFMTWPPISGSSHLFGLSESDMPALMDICDLRLVKGRLPQPHTNELVLSETMARGAEVWIGDEISRSSNEDWFSAIPSPMVVVGILSADGPDPASSPPLAIVSYEYVRDHELFAPFWTPGLVVIAREGHRDAVAAFLEEAVSPYAKVWTNQKLQARIQRVSRNFHLMFGAVDGLVAVAVALVVGIVNQMALSRRLAELGLLHAVGHDKEDLVRRLALETAVIAFLGWATGLASAWGLFALIKAALFKPYGVNLSLANLVPVWFSIPIPVAAIASVVWNARRTLDRLDAVSIIERDQLSAEGEAKRTSGGARSPRSVHQPLSPRTFYLRHRRRGLALTLTIGVMILGVAFPAFIFGPMMDAWSTMFEHLRQVSVVSPLTELSVDPAVVAQIREHAHVDSVLQAIRLQVRVDVPPMAHPLVPLYGVSENDLRTLTRAYGVQVAEGRLLQPRTNEIVISDVLAQNRGWRVGDRIGREYDAREDDELPTEMVVVGIFSSGPDRGDLWTGFVSLEYLSSHQDYALYPLRLLVLSREGHKSDVDAWLERTVLSTRTAVLTFDGMQREYRLATWLILAILGIVESVIAVVAAFSLAILSYVFFIQRRDEFGILHAMGHSRRWLMLRTLRESTGIVAMAWLLGAFLCAIGLVCMQVAVFAPKGMALSALNLAPWAFTLPMPVAAIGVSTGLVTRMLRRLDPVSVIERR